MSNNIFQPDKVKEVTKLWSDLTEQVSRSVDVLVQYRKAAIELPSGYITSLKNIDNAQKKLHDTSKNAIDKQNELTEAQKIEEQQIKRNITLKARQEKITSSVNKENTLLNEQIKELNRNLRAEAKELIEVQGEYNKVQQRVNTLTNEYRDLAIQQELNGKLNNKQLITLGKLEAEINKQQSALKKVDERIGNSRRNVGNYKSAYDGLNVSVAQVTREFPAFTNSIQTGFLAISNNLPIVVDEINRLRTANKELAASGKPTQNVFRALGKALFSFQSLLSIGITLLTVYGAELVELAFGSSKAEEAVNKLNKAREEGEKNAQKEIVQLKLLNTAVQDTSRSEKERNAILNELRQKYGEDIQHLSDKKILTEGLGEAEAILTENILKRAVAEAATQLLTENSIKLLELRRRETAQINAQRQAQEIYNESLKAGAVVQTSFGTTVDGTQVALGRLNSANKNLAETQSEINKLQQENIDLAEEALKGINISITGSSVQKKRERLYALAQLPLPQDAEREFSEYAKRAVEALRKHFDVDLGLPDEIKLPPIELPEGEMPEFFDQEQFDILAEQFNHLGRIYNIDASKFTALFDSKENTLKDYVDAASEATKGLYNLFAKNYDDDLRRNNEATEQALKFAGDSEAAKEEILRQSEKREAEIRRKQVEQERDQALFNIVVNTASGIIKTIANVGFPAAIPLIAAIGGIGLAQTLAISSQPLPEFKDGVRNFKGGPAILGDGGRSEIGVTPDGTVFKTPSKDTIYNLPKGTDIYKSESEFNKELGDMLSFNGILSERNNMPIKATDNTLTKHDFDTGIGRLIKKIGDNEGGGISFDERGIKKWVTKGRAKTIIINNRLRIKGRKV